MRNDRRQRAAGAGGRSTREVPDNERVVEWEAAGEGPLLVVSLVFMACFAVPIADQGLSASMRLVCLIGLAVTWAVFLVDYLVRLALARGRRAWFVRHLPDLVIVLLPFLRPVRAVRELTAVSTLRHRVRRGLDVELMLYAGMASVLLCGAGALVALEAERDAPGATITSFGLAAYWAATTMTMTMYGELYPITPVGRLTAVGLSVVAVGLFGVVIGAFASWYSGWYAHRLRSDESSPEARQIAVDTLGEIRALRHWLNRDEGRGRSAGSSGTDQRPPE
ncbi:potassium channel family protein [Streptomyces sp. NPDC058401]|uniref:potassium channel family protein n=1 Tax=Streptomyces sp. NPDC058401 TaxID=3346480 RepID=UPI00364CBA82